MEYASRADVGLPAAANNAVFPDLKQAIADIVRGKGSLTCLNYIKNLFNPSPFIQRRPKQHASNQRRVQALLHQPGGRHDSASA